MGGSMDANAGDARRSARAVREAREHRHVEALRELTGDGPLSPEAELLSRLLAAPLRPRTIDEALAVDYPAAIDISSIAIETIDFPVAIPSFVDVLLMRERTAATPRRISRWLEEAARGRGIKARRALMNLARQAPSEDVDAALALAIEDGVDPYSVGFAAIGLAAHLRGEPARLVLVAERAAEQAWPAECRVLTALAAVAALHREPDRDLAGRLRDVLATPTGDARGDAALESLSGELA